MSAIQLSFSLRVSSGVKTVHLLGSWDNYSGQLPLSRDKSSSKSGSWKGTFRFQPVTIEPGQRYWYYYIIDGYHFSHNPSEKSTVEPTTGRSLNILDVPRGKSSKSSKSSAAKSLPKSSSRRHSKEPRAKHLAPLENLPKGRPLSISEIKSPQPVSPVATRHLLDGGFDDDELCSRFAATGFCEGDEYIISSFVRDSPVSSSGSSLSYSSDGSISSSDGSGYSTPLSDCSLCTCERYGITRSGERVRINCGGSRCGLDDTVSSCSSSDDDGEYAVRGSHRNGIIVRR